MRWISPVLKASMVMERTNEMCTPRPRWVPAQLRQMKIPSLGEACKYRERTDISKRKKISYFKEGRARDDKPIEATAHHSRNISHYREPWRIEGARHEKASSISPGFCMHFLSVYLPHDTYLGSGLRIYLPHSRHHASEIL